MPDLKRSDWILRSQSGVSAVDVATGGTDILNEIGRATLADVIACYLRENDAGVSDVFVDVSIYNVNADTEEP